MKGAMVLLPRGSYSATLDPEAPEGQTQLRGLLLALLQDGRALTALVSLLLKVVASEFVKASTEAVRGLLLVSEAADTTPKHQHLYCSWLPVVNRSHWGTAHAERRYLRPKMQKPTSNLATWA